MLDLISSPMLSVLLCFLAMSLLVSHFLLNMLPAFTLPKKPYFHQFVTLFFTLPFPHARDMTIGCGYYVADFNRLYLPIMA